MPKIPAEDDIKVKNLSFLEATTEALPQFTLSNIILRVYGLSDSLATMILQYFSLCSSILSLLVAFVTVRNLNETYLVARKNKANNFSETNTSLSNEDP